MMDQTETFGAESPPHQQSALAPPPDLSIVVPALDEQDNVQPLVKELDEPLTGSGISWETIVVNDGSRDETGARLAELIPTNHRLRVITLSPHRGKSAAMAAGIGAARAPLIGFLDADLQNPPADLVAMARRMLDEADFALLQGWRRERCDSRPRRIASRVGFAARAWILGDRTEDAGCGLRVLRREFAIRLPLEFEGMHRFVAPLVGMLGGRVEEMPVGHRPRNSGQSKYGVGPLRRGCGGLLDLLAVRWMQWRHGHSGEPTATPGTRRS